MKFHHTLITMEPLRQLRLSAHGTRGRPRSDIGLPGFVPEIARWEESGTMRPCVGTEGASRAHTSSPVQFQCRLVLLIFERMDKHENCDVNHCLFKST